MDPNAIKSPKAVRTKGLMQKLQFNRKLSDSRLIITGYHSYLSYPKQQAMGQRFIPAPILYLCTVTIQPDQVRTCQLVPPWYRLHEAGQKSCSLQRKYQNLAKYSIVLLSQVIHYLNILITGAFTGHGVASVRSSSASAVPAFSSIRLCLQALGNKGSLIKVIIGLNGVLACGYCSATTVFYQKPCRHRKFPFYRTTWAFFAWFGNLHGCLTLFISVRPFRCESMDFAFSSTSWYSSRSQRTEAQHLASHRQRWPVRCQNR